MPSDDNTIRPFKVADAELVEHLAQMPLDRARAQEQLGGNLGIGLPVLGPPGDLSFLRRELVADTRGPLANVFPGGEELAARTLREGLCPHSVEHP